MPSLLSLEGKFHDKPHQPSETPPAKCVRCLLLDTQSRDIKSPGGNLFYLDSVEELSGDLQVDVDVSATAKRRREAP